MSLLMTPGCSKKSTGPEETTGLDSNLYGTWHTILYKIGAIELPPDPNGDIVPVIEVTLEEDGTLTYTRTQNSETTSGSGTWSTSESNASIDLEDGTTISGIYSLNDTKDELTVNATVTIDLTDDDIDNPTSVDATIVFDKGELVYTQVQIMLKATGPRFEGNAYPPTLQVTSDYAIWLEDADRSYIKTLEISPVAVTVDSAHGSHIEHLPTWAAAAGFTYADLEAETEDGVAPSFDGITGASPYFESDTSEKDITTTWDFTDAADQALEAGIYYCCAEVANIIKEADSLGTVTRFEIKSETLAMQINTSDGTFTTEEPTANLKDMTATFLTGEVAAKTIVGP